jgi:CubicO group peptidase (beta-lactamase class C family)
MNIFLRAAILAAAGFAATVIHAGEETRIADIIRPHVERGELAGAVVLVTSRDKVLSFDTIGYADVATKAPMRKDTLFWIASTSKPFVGTALMMLVDDGKIGLDDPVTRYLPQFSPKIGDREPARPITIRMLLSHTSGLGWNFPLTAGGSALGDVVNGYAQAPLVHEPGSEFSYTDADINTVGHLIEVVSGMSYDAFLHRQLLDPLGMKDTTFFPSEAQVTRLAKTYWINPSTKVFELAPAPPNTARRFVNPSGGLFSTANDLEKFCRMLLNGGKLSGRRYISESALKEMTRSQLSPEAFSKFSQPGGIDSPLSYGLGWGVSLEGAFFHPGFASTDIYFDAKRTIAVVWLLQHADWSTFPIRAEVVTAAQQRFVRRAKPTSN